MKKKPAFFINKHRSLVNRITKVAFLEPDNGNICVIGTGNIAESIPEELDRADRGEMG